MECLIIASSLILLVNGAPELFKNPGFEAPGDVSSTWSPRGSTLQLVNDTVSGQYAVKCSGRTARWMGPGQNLVLKPDTSYLVRAYAKQLNNKAGVLFQTISLSGAVHWTNGDTEYYNYASRSFVDDSLGWFLMQGSFHTPAKDFTSVDVYIQGPDPGIDFLIDDTSLTEVPPYPNWKEEANQRIEKYRKTNMEIRVQLDPSLNATDMEIEIIHRNHSFGFGTLVSDGHVLDPSYKDYQDLLFNMFNWFTVATYKWKYSQGTPNHPDYHTAVQVSEYLRSKGFPVRAHNMFWAVKGNVPSWVYPLSKEDLMKTVDARLEYMTKLTRDKVGVQHWDVNNELLHGAYFEESTGDRNYTKKMFSKIHQLDPTVKLFLNDYDVVARGGMTEAYVQMGEEFKQANVGLYGLGLQGHFRDNIRPDPALLKLRLDELSKVDLPMWITELDLYVENETLRADWYETTWRMFFSCPKMEGIIMWGFWDRLEGNKAGGSLVNGNNYYINAAGRRWLDLTKKEWSTHITWKLKDGLVTTNRGFQGDYEIIVKKNGAPIKVERFTLGKTNLTVNVVINGDAQPVSVTIPPTVPPFISGSHAHRTFHINQHSFGSQSSSNSDRFECVTRYSSLSEVGDDKKARVSCEDGEVLTSCSMQTQDHRDFRDGDNIEWSNGKATCVGVNAFRSSAPVQATARCCKLTDLKCEYSVSGPTPSPVIDGDQAVTACNSNSVATGCSSYGYYGAMDGAFHQSASCIAQMDGTGKESGGIFSYAACCSAPRLRCRHIMSDESDPSIGDTASVQCHPTEMMLGCSVYSEDGRTAGAYITNNQTATCVAVNGGQRFAGESSVKASAVCCLSELVAVVIG